MGETLSCDTGRHDRVRRNVSQRQKQRRTAAVMVAERRQGRHLHIDLNAASVSAAYDVRTYVRVR